MRKVGDEVWGLSAFHDDIFQGILLEFVPAVKGDHWPDEWIVKMASGSVTRVPEEHLANTLNEVYILASLEHSSKLEFHIGNFTKVSEKYETLKKREEAEKRERQKEAKKELIDKALEYQRIGQLAVDKVHEGLTTWVKCVNCGKSFPPPGIHTCKIPHKDVNDDSE